MSKRILMVGSYPIINPQHGGQKRSAAIYREYKKNFNTRYISVIHPVYYPLHTKDDITVSRVTKDKIDAQPALIDIICGQAVTDDVKVKLHITRLLKNYQPDVIQFEQPYMYISFKNILDEIGYKGLIVNSTHNMEVEMKRRIYESSGIDKSISSKALKIIKDTEDQLVKDSALNIVVSSSDMKAIKDIYDAKDVVLAPNGIDISHSSAALKQKWQRRYESQGVDKIALYVGSAHLPNVIGFMKMIGKKIGFLPYNTKIAVVGGVADLLAVDLDSSSISDVCFRERIDLLGRLESKDLEALLEISSVILLPITEGGGSNLKTAEALVTGKPVVTTKYALRGYEISGLPTINTTDNPTEFKELILECFVSPKPTLNEGQKKEVSQFLWPNTLKDLSNEMRKL